MSWLSGYHVIFNSNAIKDVLPRISDFQKLLSPASQPNAKITIKPVSVDFLSILINQYTIGPIRLKTEMTVENVQQLLAHADSREDVDLIFSITSGEIVITGLMMTRIEGDGVYLTLSPKGKNRFNVELLSELIDFFCEQVGMKSLTRIDETDNDWVEKGNNLLDECGYKKDTLHFKFSDQFSSIYRGTNRAKAKLLLDVKDGFNISDTLNINYKAVSFLNPIFHQFTLPYLWGHVDIPLNRNTTDSILELLDKKEINAFDINIHNFSFISDGARNQVLGNSLILICEENNAISAGLNLAKEIDAELKREIEVCLDAELILRDVS